MTGGMENLGFINGQGQQNNKLHKISILFILIVMMLAAVISKELSAQQRSPLDEQTTIVNRWINNAGFEVYSIASQQKKLSSLEVATVNALEAFFRTSEPLFYRYLAKSLLVEDRQDKQQRLSNIIKYDMELKASALATYQSLLQDADESILVPWLKQHIDLSRYQYKRDNGVYSMFFQQLAMLTINQALQLPNAVAIGYTEEIKGKRRAFLKCLSQILNIRIYDINISGEQVLSIVNFEPGNAPTSNLTVQPLDSSETIINELLDGYFTVKPAAILLLATPTAFNFILPLKGTMKKPQSISGLTNTLSQLIASKKITNHQDLSKESVSKLQQIMVWLIQSPFISIGLWLAAGVSIALFIAYAPIPYNPFVFPPGT